MSALRPEATGDLRNKPLSQLLIFLLDKRLTGALVLEDDAGGRSTVTFTKGEPRKTKIASDSHRLGALLIEYNLISAAQLDDILAKPRTHLLGQQLVNSGVLAQEALESALREQVLAHLSWLAALPGETRYGFYRDQDFLANRPPLEENVDPLAALWRVAATHPPLGLEGFMAQLGPAPIRLHADSRVRRFRLQSDERAILDVLRAKPQCVNELIATGLMPQERLERLLFVLALTRHVDVGDAGTPLAVDAPISVAALPRPGQRNVRRATSRLPASVRKPETPNPTTSNPDERDWADDIRRLVEESDSRDYFALLGVDPRADTSAIQVAFFQLAKRWHPDKLPTDLAADLRASVVKVFARMTEAHQVLTNPAQRTEYSRLMAAGQNTEEEQERVQEILRAATLFQKAEVLAKRQDWAAAEELARQALQLDSDQAEYRALHAWIRAKGGTTTSYTELIATLSTASNAHENNLRIRHYRAQVLQLAGRTSEAMREYRRIVDADPKHVDAQRELRLYQMRRSESKSPSPERSGLLRKLFKK